jgi:hypothetical protein
MGKQFYGISANKQKAGRTADKHAANYTIKKGSCWTPSREQECKFNKATGDWTCVARAHHHKGSCGSGDYKTYNDYEEHRISWTWETDFQYNDPNHPKNLEVHSEQFENTEFEQYEDALPEDYEDVE